MCVFSELPINEKSPSFISLTCSVFQKVFAETFTSGIQPSPFVMSQKVTESPLTSLPG